MPADERREIEAAMDRLLKGTPLRSDGKLTIVSLAAEAGVKRHALTHKHTDLKDLFNARVKAQHSVPASEAALRGQNEELRRKLDDTRAERDEYKQAADALARALNVLTIENDELRRKASRASRLMGPRPLTQLHQVGRRQERLRYGIEQRARVPLANELTASSYGVARAATGPGFSGGPVRSRLNRK